MTVFKAFLRVLNVAKIPIILYTVILVAFGGLNMQTSDSGVGFTASRPDVLLINRDGDSSAAAGLAEYIGECCNIIDIDVGSDRSMSDALFYRDVNYIIEIPEGYGRRLMQNEIPEITVRSTGDYQASYAQMLLSRYLKLAALYAQYIDNEQTLADTVKDTLARQTEVTVTSRLDTDRLSKAAYFFNFANYSILAGCVYVICLVLSSFNQENIRKRTVVSSTDYKMHNRRLLFSNGLFAALLWLFYILLSLVMVGRVMLTPHGAAYMLNSFVFMICALTIAFLIGNLVTNKNAISGIVNVVALGASFLCGAFVPSEFLPDFVPKIAHILPSYWYIRNNELLKTTEILNTRTLRPVFGNLGVILAFSALFVILTNIASRHKQRIG